MANPCRTVCHFQGQTSLFALGDPGLSDAFFQPRFAAAAAAINFLFSFNLFVSHDILLRHPGGPEQKKRIAVEQAPIANAKRREDTRLRPATSESGATKHILPGSIIGTVVSFVQYARRRHCPGAGGFFRFPREKRGPLCPESPPQRPFLGPQRRQLLRVVIRC
jgi:hypothetical protein